MIAFLLRREGLGRIVQLANDVVERCGVEYDLRLAAEGPGEKALLARVDEVDGHAVDHPAEAARRLSRARQKKGAITHVGCRYSVPVGLSV